MDPATILGVVIAFAAIFLANFLEGGKPAAMFLLPPMLLVFGGTFGVAMAGGLMKDTIGALKDLVKAFTAKVPAPDASVGQIVELAEQARRNGLLAATAAGLRCLVTVNGFTQDEPFDEAVLVVSELGDPGRPPVRVLADRADVRPGDQLELDDLRACLRAPATGPGGRA